MILQIDRDFAAAGPRLLAHLGKIVPVKGNIDRSNRNILSLKGVNVIRNHMGKRNTAPPDPKKTQSVHAVVFLNDFMRNAGNGTTQLRLIHQMCLEFHTLHSRFPV